MDIEKDTSLTGALRNSFKFIYHRNLYNVLAILAMLIGIFMLCFFVFDCYKNAGFMNIVQGEVISVKQETPELYAIEVSFKNKNEVLEGAVIYNKHSITPGERVDLEVVDDILESREVRFWNVASTFRYSILPFTGAFFILLSFVMMYLILNEFRLMIKLYSVKPCMGVFLGVEKAPEDTKNRAYYKIVSGKLSNQVLADNPSSRLHLSFKKNQRVMVHLDKGYFTVHPLGDRNRNANRDTSPAQARLKENE